MLEQELAAEVADSAEKALSSVAVALSGRLLKEHCFEYRLPKETQA